VCWEQNRAEGGLMRWLPVRMFASRSGVVDCHAKTSRRGSVFGWGRLGAVGGVCVGLTGVGRREVEVVGSRGRAIERDGEGKCTPYKTEPPGLGFQLGATGGSGRSLRGPHRSGVERD
jgi:hypothetical protein